MMLHPLEWAVLRHSRSLFLPGDRVVVGLSGGPDSSALLAALRAVCPLRLVAAHLDHGLRDIAEARRDVEAAGDLARDLGVPFETARVDVPALARERGSGSLEAAARAARYRFFGEVAARHQATAVAVGHTQNDQVETVLMRVLRGTGLKGLSGIPRKRRLSRSQPGVFVVRPLLAESREDVEDYLEARGIIPVVDSTNQDIAFTRNRLRNQVLPLLREQANNKVDEALLRLADQARRASRHIESEARTLLGEAAALEPESWQAGLLRAADPAIRAQALSELTQGYAPDRVTEKHVRALERLLRKKSGAIELPGGVRIRIEGDCLWRERETPDANDAVAQPPVALTIPGEAFDAAAKLRFEARVVDRSGHEPDADPAVMALLDAERVCGSLAVRRRLPGDRFWPLGAPGHRSLKRFFIDQKVPRKARGRIPVVTLNDRPVWIVGHRIDDQFKLTSSTARVLELRAIAVAGQKEA